MDVGEDARFCVLVCATINLGSVLFSRLMVGEVSTSGYMGDQLRQCTLVRLTVG